MENVNEIAVEGMALHEFYRRFHEEGPFEIRHGEIIPQMPVVSGHSRLAFVICTLLNTVGTQFQLGQAFMETTFVRPQDYSRQWVKGSRIPDVMFFRIELLRAYQDANPDWLNSPIILIPNLVVEIASEWDSRRQLHEKALLYLDDGVAVVWVIYPNGYRDGYQVSLSTQP